MKKWIIVLCAVFAVALVFISIVSPNQEQKDCCLCDSFRFHAPCLIDLETGDLIELDLYFPHETKVAELAEVQEDMSSTFSFVRLGNITGTKLTGSKVIEFGVPIAIFLGTSGFQPSNVKPSFAGSAGTGILVPSTTLYVL